MVLSSEHIRRWIFLVPAAWISFCWYSVSIYWLWWLRHLTVALNYSIVRSLVKTFQALGKQGHDHCKGNEKICITHENYKSVVNVTDPDIIKEILTPSVNAFPDSKIRKRNLVLGHNCIDSTVPNTEHGNWESVRKVISLAFTPGKFRRCDRIMEQCCQNLCHLLITEGKLKDPVDVKKVFDNFCIDMVLSTTFGVDRKSQKNPENVLIAEATELLRTNVTKNSSLRRKVTYPNPWSFLGAEFMSDNDLSRFQELIKRIIGKREENKQAKTDFLQLLIDSFSPSNNSSAHREEDSPAENIAEDFVENKALLSSDTIAHCLLIITEGYQVTSSVLSHIVYNLALNPSCQERLAKEIKEVLAVEKQVNFDSVNKMTYLDHVVCETLRLYPAVNRLQRFAAHDFTLGKKVIIPKGSKISIPLCSIHRNPQYFQNPEKFDPQRFAPAQWSKRHPYTFIPFGAGTRNCIGMKFALMEIKLCLVYLMKHVRFRNSSKTKIPLQFQEDQILLQPTEMQLRVEGTPV